MPVEELSGGQSSTAASPAGGVTADQHMPEAYQRAYPRGECSGSVRLLGSSGELIGTGVVSDLSGGGIGFYTPLPLEVNVFLAMELKTPFMQLKVNAVVVRRDSITGQYGARFVQMSEATRRLIQTSLKL